MANQQKPTNIYDNLGFTGSNDIVQHKTFDKSESRGVTSGKILVVISILVTELCERLTFYSISANMVLYCTSVLEYSDPDATSINLIFVGTVYILPLLGGYVSDSMAGRFNTIFGSGLIYLCGLFLILASAIDYSGIFGTDEDGARYDLTLDGRRAYFISGLVLVGIGTGGIKANVGPFGAQQVEDLGESVVQSFFNWFYWFINAGAIIAYTAVAYVQQEVSFAWGFFIPLASMVVALIIFLSFRGQYTHTPPTGSVLTTVYKVCRQSCKRKPSSVDGEKRFFDGARDKYGGNFNDYIVDGIICVLRVVPIFSMLIIYWAIYSQMQSTFFLQAERMDVRVGGSPIPAAMLNVFNKIVVIVLIPIVDRGINPILKKIGRPISHLQRLGIGMVLAALSVIVAGILEIYRKKDLETNGGFIQELADKNFNASSLSVFLQVPQFALVGASEVFASVSGLEFAFTQAPKSMQGMLTGLYYVAGGLGGYVANGIIQIIQVTTESEPWFPKDINNGKTEYLYFVLAGIMGVNFIIFVIIAINYKYRVQQPLVSIPDDAIQDINITIDVKDFKTGGSTNCNSVDDNKL